MSNAHNMQSARRQFNTILGQKPLKNGFNDAARGKGFRDGYDQRGQVDAVKYELGRLLCNELRALGFDPAPYTSGKALLARLNRDARAALSEAYIDLFYYVNQGR